MRDSTTKRCTKCGAEKPLDLFTKAHWTKDGRYPSCKACKCAQAATYRIANLDKVRDLARQSQARHAEKHRAASKLYYASNKGHVKARIAQYQKRRPDIRRKVRRAYHLRHPEVNGVDARHYRARQRNASGKHTAAEWAAMKARYSYRCLCCGKSEPEIKLTADHVIPLIKGGSDSIDNLQPLCLSCNSRKHTKIIDYR